MYILEKYGGMQTEQLHFLYQTNYPDLCDDSIDRVIDGKRLWQKMEAIMLGILNSI